MAIIYQISLHGSAFDARGLSWDEAIAESECKPDRAWIDPIHKRTLLKGEFGCSVSHLAAWRKIAASGLNGIILEEDAVFDEINPHHVDHKLEGYDSAWLGYRWNDMGYWYNCHAYAITPSTAKHLIDGFADAIIPVDEWVPQKLKEKKNYFYEPERVKQISRASRPSTIEDTEMLEGKDTDFRIVTVATEESKMWALEQSAARYGVTVTNIGKHHPWRDPMTGLAGMPKIQLINEYLATVPDDAVVLFMDGYDTFFADSPLEVLKRYYEMDADIVFGAERDHWPLVDDEFMRNKWPDTGTPYRYLNSGLYIGTAKALHAFIVQDTPEKANKDDQLYCQLRYLKTLNNDVDKGYDFPYTVKLDVEAYIFQNHEPNIRVVNGQLWNDETSCCGCIYHGNGGENAKFHFMNMAEKFDLTPEAEVVEPPSPYYLTLEYDEVGPDILCTDFLTDRQCDFLIHKSESYGNWGQMEGDKFPAQEIRIRQLGLWHEYERLWHEKLGKIAEQYWVPMSHIGLRDAFTMKYTVDTQKSLGLHTDASLVTGSVKLNEDFEGAEVVFPRQNFSNINVPKGRCLLWPSEVTHGHHVPDLISGTKYSLTMWTSRYKGDVNG
jgi:GR25 family glycosyltransferase involved in LPS biosynthesis